MSTRAIVRSIVTALFFPAFAFAQNAVHLNEIHYDNAGTDSGEAIEVLAPAGTELAGWQIVLYNGTGGAAYNTLDLSGVVPATCGANGVLAFNYPSNGIQNGPPDGVALVNNGQLVEFLSYEGVFAATDGVAAGATSVDIGVSEAGTEPAGQSLSRNADGTWSGPAANSFGECNDSLPPAPVVVSVTVSPPSASINVGATFNFSASSLSATNLPVPGVAYTWTSSNPAVATVTTSGAANGVSPGDATITATAPNGIAGTASLHVAAVTFPAPSDFHINEIHYDNVGVDVGEAVEIEGAAGLNVTGYLVVLYNGNGGVPYNTIALNNAFPASCGARGVLTVTYPQDGIQNGSPDGVALVSPAGVVLDFISYEGVFTANSGPAAGFTTRDIGASQTNAPLGTSLQRDSAGVWTSAASTFGACNADAPTPVGNSLSFSGRLASDPPLPVGFEDQLFATLRSPSNVTIPTTITWGSETPSIASVDANGVLHALAEGTAIVRATAAEGTTATYSLPTHVAVASASAHYGNNTEFGDPVDADPSDDFIVRHPQYAASYNVTRGAPNWVAYDLDASHFGTEDRCDCFTMDPALPASFPQISTNDYTNAGAIAGYGIDRGHMTRSFDRTSASLDNARTYYFDNVLPQASDQNQGPWAALENDLGDLARVQEKEVYIIAGAYGNKGTLKNEGKIVIPTHTWKVALILPRDHGLADIHDYRDVETIAVIMPNEAGVRNVPWQTYQTTIDAIEAASGYDLLSLLPDDVEAAVESNTQPPLATATGPTAAIEEGGSATFSAAGSVDPNGSIVSYAWDFGDGTAGSGASATHVYAQDGVYVVRLTVTDNDGLTAAATARVTVANVAPVVSAVADSTVNLGASATVAGSFTDPGADAWTASVDWGDGSASVTTGTATRSFSLAHTYATAGLFTVTVTISDDDASGSTTTHVTVAQPSPGLAEALRLIDGLIRDRKIGACAGHVLKAEVQAAQALLARGNNPAAKSLLKMIVAELDGLVRMRLAKAADVAPLRAALLAVYKGI